jgi:hypothetical protein
MTKEEYEDLVSNVMKGYKTAKKATPQELMEFAKSMHAQWKDIESAAGKKMKKTTRTAKKVMNKTKKKLTK